MRSQKAEKEDPAVVAQREREERRAEAARTEETQGYLIGATQRRLRRFGRVAGGSGGNVPLIAPSGGGRTVTGGSGGGFLGGGGGSSTDFGGGMQLRDVALY